MYLKNKILIIQLQYATLHQGLSWILLNCTTYSNSKIEQLFTENSNFFMSWTSISSWKSLINRLKKVEDKYFLETSYFTLFSLTYTIKNAFLHFFCNFLALITFFFLLLLFINISFILLQISKTSIDELT